MTENAKKYLTTARDFLVTGDLDNACVHYFEVSKDAPENAEAEFFGAYLGYQSLVEENSASAVNAFKAMAACLEKAVKCVKESDVEDIGKGLILEKIVEVYTPITRFVFKKFSTTASTIETGVLGLYALGNAIKKEFGSNPEAMKQAAVAWKEAVALQREFYAYKYNGVKPEDYEADIKKVDPTYTMPKKAGCVTLG